MSRNTTALPITLAIVKENFNLRTIQKCAEKINTALACPWLAPNPLVKKLQMRATIMKPI